MGIIHKATGHKRKEYKNSKQEAKTGHNSGPFPFILI